MMMPSLIRNTIYMLVSSRKNSRMAAREICSEPSVVVNITDPFLVHRVVAHVDTPRVRTSIRRPKQFAFLSVQVPGEEERHMLPDLPAQAFDVYPNLPKDEMFGSSTCVSLKRLEHIKLLDNIAYKLSVAQGFCTPMPPKLRA